jgi:hypothetical protein
MLRVVTSIRVAAATRGFAIYIEPWHGIILTRLEFEKNHVGKETTRERLVLRAVIPICS